MSTELAEIKPGGLNIGMRLEGDRASLVPQNLGEIVTFAQLMSRASVALPKHLRDNPGACLAVAMRAFNWEMEPFAVATKTYFVNDMMAFEAQLIAAVVIKRAPISGRPKYAFSGEGQKRRCTVTCVIDGEAIEYQSPEVGQIKVKNSPLWVNDPDQQLGYYSIRAWARRHTPDVIMGVYDPDEARERVAEEPDKATSFEALEARAKAATVEAEQPRPQPAAQEKRATISSGSTGMEMAAVSDLPEQKTQPTLIQDTASTDKASPRESLPDTVPQSVTAAESPAVQAEPASPASTDSTPTDAGTPATGADTSAQATLALDGGAGGAEPALDGFAAYADAVAAASDWPSIKLALGHLGKTAIWNERQDLRGPARRIAYERLHELVAGGLKFDFITDASAYRCYLEFETDLEAMRAHRALFSQEPVWNMLDTQAKIMLDRAYATREQALKGAADAGDLA